MDSLKTEAQDEKHKQMSFYNTRYCSLSRASNKLSNLPMLFYDKRLISMIMEISGERKTSTVLDVGTGQGTDAVLLSENTDHVVAIDISINALRTARILSHLDKTHRNISFILADAENLPLKEDIFDVVYCKDVLHHVTNALLTVLEMKRVARGEARLVAVEANAYNPQMIIIGLIYFSVDKGVFKNTRFRLSNIFSRAGLSNVDVTEIEVLPRQVLFEYRSPLISVLGAHYGAILRLLEKIESGWQKHTTLRKFSNYIIVSGSKKAIGVRRV